MSVYRAKAFLFGKKRECVVIDGVHYIDGMTVHEFFETSTPEEREKAFFIGLAAINTEKRGEYFSPTEMYNQLKEIE